MVEVVYTTHEAISAAQPKIPEPWLPEHFIEHDTDNLPEVLEELARQLTVANDYYYPLIAAASRIKRNGDR